MANFRDHPPGTIAVPCNDLARYSVFTFSLATLEYPLGTEISMVRSMDVSASLNQMIRDRNSASEWVWIMGDDHVFAPDTLFKLLDCDVDVVVPLCCKRNPPYDLVLFHEDGTELRDGREYPSYRHLAWDEIPESGLFEVDAAGSAGMLVRREVLAAVGDPWFESSSGVIINDDLEFCRKIHNAGYTVHACADASIGHVGHATAIPQYRNNMWGAGLDLGGGFGASNVIWLGDPRQLARQFAGSAS